MLSLIRRNLGDWQRKIQKFSSQSRKIKPHSLSTSRPRLELLEDRTLPSIGLPVLGSIPDKAGLLATFGQVPLRFEQNQGQTDPQVRFLSRGPGYSLFLTSSEAVLRLNKQQANQAAGTLIAPVDSLRVQFVGANPDPKVSGDDEMVTRSNYFIGNDPSQWHANVTNYGKVEYQDLYSGINLVYYDNQQQLEYDFQVAPGADASVIRLNFEGAQSVELDASGNLVLHESSGDVVEHAPVIYQEIGGVRQTVSGQFVLEGNNQVGFEVGAYDKSKTLVIDPVLAYSTYLGGSDYDNAFVLAVDAAGEAYVAGRTASANFPTLNPVQGANGGNFDVFVSKLNTAGNALVYSTYLGGNGEDVAQGGMAVDAAGNAYVSGFTGSSNFPTVNAIQASYGGSGDAFVLKLNPTGSTLLFSTYLGGSSKDVGMGLALDSSGNAYVSGGTSSTDFRTVNPYQSSNHGRENAFLTKIASDGSSIIYSTYLGGSGGDQADYQGIAVDSSGSAYLVGDTTSNDFPLMNPFQASYGGSDDAFVTKFTPDGSALVYSSYLGGNQQDIAQAIAVDSSGYAYLGGLTDSANFPTFNALQSSSAGGRDAFITKVSPDGSSMIFSTYLGGSGEDRILSLALDGANNPVVTGQTQSSNFPTTVNAYQPVEGGGYDAFVTKMNTSGTGLIYSTFLGGSNDDFGQSIAVDSSGNIYVAGGSASTNFPTVNPFQGTYGGGAFDAFVTKFVLAPTASLSGPTDGFQGVRGQSRTFTLGATDPVPANQAAGFTYAVNWGDGSSETDFGLSGIQVSHVYNAVGNYTITMTATDKDGATSAPVTLPIGIKIVEQQGSTLAVGGTPNDDTVLFAAGSTGTVKVTVNGALQGTFTTGQVFTYGAAGNDTITIQGTGGADAFTINSTNVAVRGVTIAANSVEGWNVNGGAGNDTFAINGSGLVARLNGGADNDKFTIGTGVVFDGTLDGSTGVDTLVGGDTDNTWSLTGSNTGTLNGSSFTGIENLTGGAGQDLFQFQPGGGVTGLINGGTNNDTLDYSAYGSPVSIDLQTLTGTGLDHLQNIEILVGSTGSDTLTGLDKATTWQITDNNSGKAGTYAFSSFENLVGGSGADVFKFSNGKGVSGSVDGGGGGDTLNYSAYTTAITVNLATGAATGVAGGVSEIQVVIGGSGNDTLTGGADSSILVGGAGNDLLTAGIGRALLIGGKGSDTLIGGPDEDLLIGGTTNYDTNATSLLSIMSEWQRTDETYQQRIDHLRGTSGGGLNGTILLNSSTVHDDSVSDTLTGGAGLDWFWASLVQDVLTDKQTGEQVN
jgi:hypothetical protein